MNTKNLNIFLMNGTTMGPSKSTISTWSGVIYKVPRNFITSELIVINKDIISLKSINIFIGET